MPKLAPDVSDPLPPFERCRRETSLRAPLVVAFLALAIGAGCSAGGGGGRSALPSSGSPSRGISNISGALPATSPTPVPADQAGCTGATGCQVKRNANAPASATYTTGLTAAQLRSAYGLPAASGAAIPTGPVIAIVDAFDDKTAEADLGKYRRAFGLPDCTSTNGCFQKVNIALGSGTKPPSPSAPGSGPNAVTWADETALDLAMASAACPACRLLLVEAPADDLDTLASAVNTAAGYGPAAIAVSWGVTEGGANTANIDAGAQAAFNHPGIAITAATGDAGVVQFPASSPYVTAVGGTTLTQDGSARGWSETVWTPTGDGCSVLYPVPTWQSVTKGCSGRSVPDVSVVGDFNTGVAVFSSAQKGWVVLGGTSVGAPFVAGLYAAAGDYGAATTGAPSLYASLSQLNTVGGGGVSPNGLAGF